MNLTEAQHKLSSDISRLYETYQLISKSKNQFNELDIALLQQQLLYVYHSLLKVQGQLDRFPHQEEEVLSIAAPEPVKKEEPTPAVPFPVADVKEPEQQPVEEPPAEEQEPVMETQAPVPEPSAQPEPVYAEPLPEPTIDDLERLMKEQEEKEEQQLSLLAPEPVVNDASAGAPAATPKPQAEESTVSLLDKLSASMRTPDVHEKISRENNQSLKQAINLNKKIAFVNNLFNENTVEYAKAIEKLNSAGSSHEALRYFSELKHQYNWNNENPLVKDLEQMIERRFN